MSGPEESRADVRGPGVPIRVLRPGDAAAAKELIREVWREHFAGHSDPGVRGFMAGPGALEDLDDLSRREAESCRKAFFGAWDGRSLVGTGGVVEIDARTAELRHLFVRADCRRKGIGTRLSLRLIDLAMDWQMQAVRLGSNRALHASHRLYRKLGFREIPPFEVDGAEHAIYMMLDLRGTAADDRVT